MTIRPPRIFVLATLLLALGARVPAQTLPAPEGVLHLSTSATQEVTEDILTVVFTTSHEGRDAQAVQGRLKQALDAALGEARGMAQSGQVEVQTGQFTLQPRYTSVPARPTQASLSGWQGSAELLVRGRDIAAIAQLSARIQTMSIARVGYSLSRQAREKVETELVAQAIAQWRARATQMSQQLGYASYRVREVTVVTNEPPGQPVPMMRMRAMSAEAASDVPLPTEAGRAEVVVTVQGSAQMMK